MQAHDLQARARRSTVGVLLFLCAVLLVGCGPDGASDGSPSLSDLDVWSGDAPTIAADAGQPLPPQARLTFPDSAIGLESYEGQPVGFTAEGYPFRGDPNAPLTLVEYSDYLCPYCSLHFNQVKPALLATYGAQGRINFVFRDFPIAAIHPNAPLGHAAALCVAEQGAARFWAMHDGLFRTQTQWANHSNPAEFIATLAESAGADMTAYTACMAAGTTAGRVTESAAAADAMGFAATPSFHLVINSTERGIELVGAQPTDMFGGTIDALMAGEALQVARAAGSGQASTSDPDTLAQVTFDFEDELETFAGLPAGFTAEGYPFLGNPDAAVSLVEFSDYLCPFCGRHFNQTFPTLLQQYGADGEVNFVFRDYPIASLHPTAHVGHEAALCVGEQGAARYWAMHDELFAKQQQWANLPDPTAFVSSLAQGLEVDMDAFDQCMSERRYRSLVEERVAAGQTLGLTGTPTFQLVVNETGAAHEVSGAQPINVFAEALDALLAGEEVPAPEAPEPAELPLWASAEGLAPDPGRPGYTVAGDPFKGNPEAEVVVVEFSDFQCPACQQHALEIQPALDQALIDSGEIMWVFKSLPLGEHDQALRAATAAECAGEQGRFWEMHHLLFDDSEAWSVDEVDDALRGLSDRLGLDMAAFDACYNGRAALERVVQDMYDAQGITESTPAFVVLSGGRGTLLSGSRPVDQFERLLRSRFAQEGPDG